MFDRQALPSLLGTNDASVLQEFYQLFIEHTTRNFSLLDQGINIGDKVLIEHCVHILASNCKMLGGLEIATILDAMSAAAEKDDLGSLSYQFARLRPLFARFLGQISELKESLRSDGPVS